MSKMLDLAMFSRSHMRLVRQTEAAECGLASLAMIAAFHGLDIDLQTLRQRFATSLRGVTLKTLMGVADRINLTPRAVQLPLEKLADLHLPAILHWDLNHFVVVERVKSGKALIHNPDGRSGWYTLDQLSPHFTGIALELRPSATFTGGTERRTLRLSQLWHRMTGLKRAMVQTALLSLVMQAYIIALPYYMQVAIDTALPALDRDLLTVLALGFGLFAAINAGASLLRSFVLLSAGSSLGFGVASNIARRLFRLPVDWFEKRSVGDVLSRFQSIIPIQKLLTEGAVGALLDGSLAIVTLVMMFFYSPLLACISLVALGVYAIVRLVSFPYQREAQEESIVTRGKEQSILIETLRGMTTLRLFGRETMRHVQWQSRLTDSVNADIRVNRVGIWQDVAKTLLFGVENVVSIWLAIRFVIDGGFSVGMVFAYMSFKTQFMDKATALINQSIAFRMIGLHLERLSDIALSTEDSSFGASANVETKLKGHVDLKNVTYRYSPSDPLVLDGVSLSVQPGEHIAITGPSGGGKSTLVKLLLGLLEPYSGEILFDGLPLDRFGHRSYREQVSAVLQDDSLFSGSLADNIALFDEASDRAQIVQAATDASIHEDIMQMPMGYETLVGDMGSTLSGGQKQRILLARALYRRPSLLIMDEGTAHLDKVHEAAVNRAIAAAGITRIIIAHRAETLANAEKIYALIGGRLILIPPRSHPEVAPGAEE
ncbi:ATP-binding cassette subfamily B protein RaxB [Sphingomonas sp. UYAg733]